MLNQNQEQITRDHIDKQLFTCGRIVLDINKVNLHAGTGEVSEGCQSSRIHPLLLMQYKTTCITHIQLCYHTF